MAENNTRDYGPHDIMNWHACNLAWVFAANSKAELDDPERRIHGYMRDIIRVPGIERPYVVRPRGKSSKADQAFAWVRGTEL